MFKLKGLNAVGIKINDKVAATEIWSNSEIDLSEYLSLGENNIELVLVNNLRNLLGPHHLEKGEEYMVCPASFFKGETFWLWNLDFLAIWNDNYCFVETSLLTENGN